MGDNEELSEFMQDYNDDCQATITAGQLQHLVNEKNAAEARIQELEANQVVCAAGCRERKELLESKVKIKQLEAQAERLRGALSVLAHQCKGVDGWEQFPSAWIDAAESFIDETPAQSLEAVKREAAQKAADYICHKLRYDFDGPRDMDATEDFIDNLDLSECINQIETINYKAAAN